MSKEYKYNATIVSVYDGDTLTVDIDLGFDIILQKQKVRINGIDTPEKRTRRLLEKTAGNCVKEYVQSFLTEGKEVVLISKEIKGKFGRILGDIYLSDLEITLSEHLLNCGLAVEYHGKKKQSFTEEHLEEIILFHHNFPNSTF